MLTITATKRFSLWLFSDSIVQYQGFIIRYWVHAAPVDVPDLPYWMLGGGEGGGGSTRLCDARLVIHGQGYEESAEGACGLFRMPKCTAAAT